VHFKLGGKRYYQSWPHPHQIILSVQAQTAKSSERFAVENLITVTGFILLNKQIKQNLTLNLTLTLIY